MYMRQLVTDPAIARHYETSELTHLVNEKDDT